MQDYGNGVLLNLSLYCMLLEYLIIWGDGAHAVCAWVTY